MDYRIKIALVIIILIIILYYCANFSSRFLTGMWVSTKEFNNDAGIENMTIYIGNNNKAMALISTGNNVAVNNFSLCTGLRSLPAPFSSNLLYSASIKNEPDDSGIINAMFPDSFQIKMNVIDSSIIFETPDTVYFRGNKMPY